MSISLQLKTYDGISLNQLISIFTEYESKPWSFWLDSGEAVKPLPLNKDALAQNNQNIQTNASSYAGRYHIMVHSPDITFEFKQGKWIIKGKWLTQPPSEKIKQNLNPLMADIESCSCPFEKLNIIQTFYKACFDLTFENDLNLPFLAGAVGAFAYDLNTYTDKIIDSNPEQFDLDDISVGFYSSSLIYDSTLNKLHHYHHQASQLTTEHLDSYLRHEHEPCENSRRFTLTHQWQSNLTEQSYCEKFYEIDEYLKAGDCYQVNFAQRFSAAYKGSELDAYLQLREHNKAPFSAFMRLPKSCILSVSPERFLLVEGYSVETKPIKGTRKRSVDPIIDKALSDELLNAEKDRAENLMIVDLLRNDLSKHCEPHSVQVPLLFKLESYPAVHHMVSTVRGKLKADSSPYDLLKGAFPGGSITGAPKVRAMQIIQELEPDKRSIYCGSIGYIGIKGDMDTNICIRTILAERGTMHCWAGGGIVYDSEAKDEFQESLHKVNKILPVLEMSTKDDRN